MLYIVYLSLFTYDRDRGPYHTENSQLTCRGNQWTSFYMKGNSAMRVKGAYLFHKTFKPQIALIICKLGNLYRLKGRGIQKYPIYVIYENI